MVELCGAHTQLGQLAVDPAVASQRILPRRPRLRRLLVSYFFACTVPQLAHWL